MSESGKQYEALTPEEVVHFESQREAKDQIFVFSDSFDYKAWDTIRTHLNKLEQSQVPLQEKAEEFITIFQDTYTAPYKGGELGTHLPAFAVVDLFERSFRFFEDEVDQAQKEELIDLQLRCLTEQSIPEEARNAMKGMWGFIADPEKRQGRKTDEATGIREPFARALHEYRISHEESGALRRLSSEERQYLYLSEEESWKHYDKETLPHEIRYYAKLYEDDAKPLTPEARGFLMHELARDHSVSKRYEKTDIIMSPHDRLYTFERNRFPRQTTIDEERVLFLISSDPAVLNERLRKTPITGDILPRELIDYFRNRVERLRYSKEYRSKDIAEKGHMRKELREQFIGDLLNFSSLLWEQIREQHVLGEEDVERLTELLHKYQSGKGEPYLVWSIGIHKKIK